GSGWAVAHARRFRDEVLDRIEQGLGASSNERIRLMWIGAGVWHDPGFYQALEERLGAVFTWSMYLPFSGAQYIRRSEERRVGKERRARRSTEDWKERSGEA